MDEIVYVGLDVHKATIAVAIAPGGRSSEIRYYGSVPHRPGTMADLARKLAGKHPDQRLTFCYEAGACGYGLARELTEAGHECLVVAPSLIPSRPGDHIKTDKRDATALAKMHRAGELTSVWVPDTQHEAIRDLVRARETAMYWRNKARQALSSFLLRQGYRYNGTKAWTVAYWRWLATLEMEHPAQQIAMQEYILAIKEADARHDRLVQQIEVAVPSWSMAPLVASLQAMRGIALITAATIVGEIGDISRFESPRRLMAYLGLVPAEHSSGTKIRRRGITKAGNARVRRLLVESAWTYCRAPRVSQSIQRRQEGLDLNIVKTAWKAQLRLHDRYRRLSTTGKPKNVVITAIAREFVGFIWAIGQQVAATGGGEERVAA
ncbi:IS110 family transposase [Rhizorhabdus wittichii]|uniref:IS110 family transposase n=1 Tax=Rhizorhabdus wittichii TaxID=160791 RepID=A0A975D3H7_9SPHN|nr:IS110 family transposase [Rhizorhabdus wittichii]QTH22475.1 IS110 family transposase [Rhizorhabdus wittichii]